MKSSSTTCEVSLSSSDHLAGDLVRATVCFRGNNETLDWAAVQIHGHSWYDPKLVSPMKDAQSLSPFKLSPRLSQQNFFQQQLSPKASTTAAAVAAQQPGFVAPTQNKTAMPDMSTWVEGSTCLFATKPHCLCAELFLVDSESVTYTVECKLPPVLPPSFRGTCTRYGYLITICVKVHTEQFARVAHVPFFVAGVSDSQGDAARVGLPSQLFMEKCAMANSASSSLVGKRGVMTRNSSSFSSQSELDYNNHKTAATSEQGEINQFPQVYTTWEGEVRSERADLKERMVWMTERDVDDDEEEDERQRAAARMPPSPPTPAVTTPNSGIAGGGKAFNASTSKLRIARCFVTPVGLHPGDACNVKLDLYAEAKVVRVRLAIEVEESIMGPPPLVAAFEPLLVKRSPTGPWIRTVSSRTVDVSLCQTVCVSLSTFGAPANFSTDLVFVHSFLKLEFHQDDGAVNTMRVGLTVRPNVRTTRCVSFSPEFHAASPKPASSGSTRRLEDQSPPPTPKKKLVF